MMNQAGTYAEKSTNWDIRPSTKNEDRTFKDVCALFIKNAGTVAVMIGENTIDPGESRWLIDDNNMLNVSHSINVKFIDAKVVPGCDPVKRLEYMTRSLVVCKCTTCSVNTISFTGKKISSCPTCS